MASVDATTAVMLTHAESNILVNAVSTSALDVDPSFPADSVLISGALDFDVCPALGGFIVAYVDIVTHLVRVQRFSYSFGGGPPVSIGTVSAAGEATACSSPVVDADESQVWVAYSNGSAVRMTTHDPLSLIQATGPITIDAVPATPFSIVAKTSAAWVGYADTSAPYTATCIVTPDGFMYSPTHTANVLPLTGILDTGLTPTFAVVDAFSSTEAITQTPNSYLLVATQQVPDATGTHHYVGRIDTSIAGGPFPRPPHACTLPTEAVSLIPYQLDLSQNRSESQMCGLRLLSVTMGANRPKDADRVVSYNREIFITGGLLSVYDGQQVFDYGFSREPTIADIKEGMAGGSMQAGDYVYGFVAEYYSASGLKYRSPPALLSKPFTLANANYQTLVDLNSITVGNKGPVDPSGWYYLTAYRTPMGQANPQQLSIPPSFNMVLNDGSAQLSHLVDTIADGDIGNGIALAERPAIYTQGGDLADEQPPAQTTMTLHMNRLWIVDGSRHEVWFTKSFLDDEGTAPGFASGAFRFAFEREVVALASLDDKLVVFGRNWMQYIIGQGPAANGQNSDLQGPFEIPTDAGCINPRSVISTPVGVLFQSTKGLQLLSRALEVSWVGRPVRETLAQYHDVTSAVLVASANTSHVRFTCNTSDGTSGLVLVWDYAENQWATSKYWADGVYGTPFADACIYRDQYTLVTPLGTVLVEEETTNQDDTHYVPIVIETTDYDAAAADVAPGTVPTTMSSPLSFQSVRRLVLEGVSQDHHDLTVDIAFDGEDAFTQTHTFEAGSAVTSPGKLEHCQVMIGARRKARQIRFRFSDSAPSNGLVLTTGKGPVLETFGLEVGTKKGFKHPAAERKG
ncbi:MAG: hypothetical protein FWD69_10120 [Polyangiaceae bacterium]|nr:hypothetical protein [Polyangiaceae bacterium]